ncbi:tryptophan synthase beta subunit-like PLP-dependent enzyme [Viridothelium virens]|uniref:threonine synthase n=1 Tax=Viridothelium virens TaxID=1048519 RepID=A0A6A6HKQ6_VIRVR|nr:tryptophan synthase beta subunit-like PLP-dependent enzyme [Viridothelium virens]
MASHTASQRYLSTRGGSYGLSFEEVVLKGLASDSGLFIPEVIPSLPPNWQNDWLKLSFEELAFQVFSLFISPAEIPPAALKDIIHRSYSTFRVLSITPTVTLDGDKRIHLLELFHGPTFAFKDVALQFLGNLFEFFLVRRNEGKTGKDREHLTVIGATSGDTGSAAIYGLRSKKDVSVFIMYPTGKVSSVQEAQMTTVPDENVHCLSVDGTFDDCQDFVKALFADPLINTTQRLAAVNSINWARILAQITYYFASYFSLVHSGTFNPSTDHIRFVVPTGNFGDILAGYIAKRMGLPVSKLIIATNENDILHRFWRTGAYEKQDVHGSAAEGGLVEDGVKAHVEGVKETLSPAMDILVSSNFERLLWFIAYDVYGFGVGNVQEGRHQAALKVKEWQTSLKTQGGFKVEKKVLDAATVDFASERVSDEETLAAISDVYRWPNTPGSKGYILDPHSAIGVTAALRSAKATPGVHNVALSTAHPAKFSHAVELALKEEKEFQFKDILPPQFVGLEDLPRRITHAQKSGGLEGVRKIIMDEVEKELTGAHP